MLKAESGEVEKPPKEEASSEDFKIKLIAMLAHDFRGAFLNMLSLMDFYQRGEIPEESFSELFEELKVVSRNNLNAFGNTLQWVKTQMGGYVYKPGPVAVAGLMGEIAGLYDSELKRKNISLSVQGDADIKMLADAHLLRFVLGNLLHNAIKFSYPGGQVDCRITSVEQGTAEVQIIDQGTGMAEETLQSLFQHDKVIHTGTLGEKGAGIALVICKDFAKMQHGTLAAASAPGKGAVFTLRLPAA